MISLGVFHFLLTALIAGVLLYLFNTSAPGTNQKIRVIISVVVVLLLGLYGLQVIHVIPWDDWPTIKMR